MIKRIHAVNCISIGKIAQVIEYEPNKIEKQYQIHGTYLLQDFYIYGSNTKKEVEKVFNNEYLLRLLYKKYQNDTN